MFVRICTRDIILRMRCFSSPVKNGYLKTAFMHQCKRQINIASSFTNKIQLLDHVSWNDQPKTSTIRFFSTTDNTFTMEHEISCGELHENIENNKTGYYVIDVREPREIETHGKIPGSYLIPLGELEGALSMTEEGFENKYGFPKLPCDGEQLIFQCATGGRSLKATMMARSIGCAGARNLIGGIIAWNDLQEKLSKKD